MKKNTIHMNAERNAKGMAERLRSYMIETENMDAQILLMEDGGYMIQGKTRSVLRTMVGMKKAITAKITPMGDNVVELEIGEGKWQDKVIAGTLSLFVLWPLAVTASVGAVQQGKLPSKLLHEAEMYAV